VINQSLELGVFVIFLFAGVISIFFGIRMVSKPGVSIEVRKLILSRHIGYILTYSTCNMFIAIRNFYYIFSIDADSFNNQWYVVVFGVLFYSQGIAIVILRCFEPAFF